MKGPTQVPMTIVVEVTQDYLSQQLLSHLVHRKKAPRDLELTQRSSRLKQVIFKMRLFLMLLQRFTVRILHLITPFLGKNKDNIQVPEVLS